SLTRQASTTSSPRKRGSRQETRTDGSLGLRCFVASKRKPPGRFPALVERTRGPSAERGDDEHREGCRAKHLLGHPAHEQAREARSAVRGHGDEIGGLAARVEEAEV